MPAQGYLENVVVKATEVVDLDLFVLIVTSYQVEMDQYITYAGRVS